MRAAAAYSGYASEDLSNPFGRLIRSICCDHLLKFRSSWRLLLQLAELICLLSTVTAKPSCSPAGRRWGPWRNTTLKALHAAFGCRISLGRIHRDFEPVRTLIGRVIEERLRRSGGADAAVPLLLQRAVRVR